MFYCSLNLLVSYPVLIYTLVNKHKPTMQEGIMGSKGRHNEKKPKQNKAKKEEAKKTNR
jgi:hypothetical protein